MQANGVVPGDEEWAFGCKVTVKTCLDEEITGTIFTFDRVTNLLVLSDAGSRPGSVSYRFLKMEHIKEIVSVETPSEVTRKTLEAVRLEECVRREEDAVRAIEVEHAPGVEVIEAGQKLISKLAEGYACHFEGRTIIVEDKVFIDPPYTIADFRSSEEDSDFRETLKLMVDDDS